MTSWSSYAKQEINVAKKARVENVFFFPNIYWVATKLKKTTTHIWTFSSYWFFPLMLFQLFFINNSASNDKTLLSSFLFFPYIGMVHIFSCLLHCLYHLENEFSILQSNQNFPNHCPINVVIIKKRSFFNKLKSKTSRNIRLHLIFSEWRWEQGWGWDVKLEMWTKVMFGWKEY